MQDTTVVRLERDGDIAVIVHHDSARMNPLGLPFQHQLRDLLAQVRADTGIRALVLTAEGRGFCAGADLTAMGGAPADGRTLGEYTAERMEQLSNRLILDLQQLPVPVVCAVNGAAAGAGVGLALAADLTLVARSAYFYLPFLPRLGIVPDLGTTWFIERRLGRARAMGLALMGERLGARQAADWGLVWDCVDDAALRDAALSAARRLARLPAGAALEARRALDAAATHTLEQQLCYEAGRQRELVGGPDFVEGVQAFLQKREPAFAPRRPG
ncbi:Probable enoyl-CoA hydratase echA8 [Delftia tsuruhatensis]|uniref:enoyl-CoA hydratase-related protein n=1 Tax=Delftia tsuruhatensis TaxID=180282 RepID=UPI001E76B25D|nr:enoyl-CoA hydratase-related protein [Delftia tsuruhatensis]CAB5708036.1 Probable enoyl-CoA hydratase echA8 [Delftia tsuruhatensis]CAC9680584.1 Probable enoyl-CoA hydratase echA8 [Delftia tsuruhatensis]